MISIIIPVYNVFQYLNACIQSVVNQSYRDFECILVDDGSSDGSEIICDQWELKDSRIKVIHQSNQGVSKARNRGITEAQGEYIAFIDSDDWIEENYLTALLEPIAKDVCDLSVMGMISDYNNGTSIKSIAPKGKINFSSQNNYNFVELERKFLLFGPCTKLYKKSIIDQYNITFNPEFSYGEDLIFNYEYLNYVTSIYVIDKAYYHYRILNSTNLSSKFNVNIFNINYFQWNILKEFHIKKQIYNIQAKDFLYTRLWGIIYDSIFLIHKHKKEYPIKAFYNFISNILSIPEIQDKEFINNKFICSKWLKKLILDREKFILTILLVIKK